MCGYEMPTNLQYFTQKDLTEVKIFQKVLGGYFFETPCSFTCNDVTCIVTYLLSEISMPVSIEFVWMRPLIKTSVVTLQNDLDD